ncbi:hypothetical protein GXP67_21050 [Rhodocytophaga rosea]|uniref:Uncharacterized protein n=1 Tax=Rhodocytophaga rosea TaxID=2704465 RepID=A0A6C0GLQ7_9BACT|nr:hypothetical protein [Rhodocytophaga rosea]QHT68958.1 hypothetical protein GXP67_21050 [Rhodocytophaga rosea]
MDLLSVLFILLLITKAILLVVIYFLWRSNSRLKEANHIIFLMKRRGIINEKLLEEIRKANPE